MCEFRATHARPLAVEPGVLVAVLIVAARVTVPPQTGSADVIVRFVLRLGAALAVRAGHYHRADDVAFPDDRRGLTDAVGVVGHRLQEERARRRPPCSQKPSPSGIFGRNQFDSG